MTPPVTLFIQCLLDAFHPEACQSILDVFRRLNISVLIPEDQTCCGQPAFNSGYRREAGRAARHFLDVFQKADIIVCPSGSCVYMIRHHYPVLFQNDRVRLNQAREIGSRIYEFSEFLVDVLGVVDVNAAYSGRVTYHDSCHLARGLGIREQPRQLIRHVRGAELVEMPDSDRCCGFGGGFSIKYADISAALVDDKVNAILASGADTVVGCDMGCLMNIEGRLSRTGSAIRVMHIAELLVQGGITARA
ncbi:MAG TPA: (Fe-S)-binding protein [Desulfatirhabdiaceae bacterium]|nr:(Fe-S)-binding protein [Desulfatirhabdiaceae bacterium]